MTGCAEHACKAANSRTAETPSRACRYIAATAEPAASTRQELVQVPHAMRMVATQIYSVNDEGPSHGSSDAMCSTARSCHDAVALMICRRQITLCLRPCCLREPDAAGCRDSVVGWCGTVCMRTHKDTNGRTAMLQITCKLLYAVRYAHAGAHPGT